MECILAVTITHFRLSFVKWTIQHIPTARILALIIYGYILISSLSNPRTYVYVYALGSSLRHC